MRSPFASPQRAASGRAVPEAVGYRSELRPDHRRQRAAVLTFDSRPSYGNQGARKSLVC